MWWLRMLPGTPDGFQVTMSKIDLDAFSFPRHMCFHMGENL